MTSSDKTKVILKKMSFQTGDRLRRDMKRDVVAAYQPAGRVGQITRLVLAACVCLGFVIALYFHLPPTERAPEFVAQPVLSLSQRTTSWSLDRVFKAGGLEALDDHFFETNKLVGPRPGSLSIEDFLDDSDF